jgi:hypothetical protein
MRIAAIALVGAFGLSAAALSANAAPIAPTPPGPQVSNIVEVAGGCGWRFHPNRWGRCVPNYGPHAYWRPHWRGYYGGGYGPWGWSSSDHVANELNRRQLGHMYGY